MGAFPLERCLAESRPLVLRRQTGLAASVDFIYPRWPISAMAWAQYLFSAGVIAAIALLWIGRGRLGADRWWRSCFFLEPSRRR